MSDPRERIEELKYLAWSLGNGQSKVALYEEAVQLADSLHDIDLAFELRSELIDVATFSGRGDILLVAFAWCLAQYDREPSRFDDYDILWKYKWVLANAPKFPQIERSQLEALLADMERRYRRYGASMYAVASQRRSLMIDFGERALAEAAHTELQTYSRDSLSDCPACVASTESDYYGFLKQWERCIEAAEPLLAGRLRCSEQPHATLARVLLPLVRLGRMEEANAHHAHGYRLVSRETHFVLYQGRHLAFLVVAHEWTKARRVFERHVAAALEAAEPEDRFEFLHAGLMWCRSVVERGTRKLKLRLPAALPAPDEAGKVDVRACEEWFLRETQELARQFDARNGTSAFSDRIEEIPELMRLVAD